MAPIAVVAEVEDDALVDLFFLSWGAPFVRMGDSSCFVS
jgi:hypothetical protein